jgi:glycerol-3-phosphate O-acyltransferase
VALAVALRTFHEINRITVATPSSILATVLLTLRDSRFDLERVRSLSLWLVELLRADDVELADLVSKWTTATSEDSADAFAKTVRAFTRGGRIRVIEKGDNPVFEVPAAQRLPLDYYKNNIVHFFAPASLLASSLLAAPETGIERDQLLADLELGSRLYRWEFMLPLGEPTDGDTFGAELEQLADDAIESLVRSGVAERSGQRLVLINRERACFLADVLLNFHEVYSAGLTTVRDRAIGETTGDPARRARNLIEERVQSGAFLRAEGRSRLAVQSAFQAFKDLRILRPAAGEQPFEEDGLGARLLEYAERCLSAAAR